MSLDRIVQPTGPPAQAGDPITQTRRELAGMIGPTLAEVYTYPGGKHLFTDSSLPSYDADATALVLSRSREFLDRLG